MLSFSSGFCHSSLSLRKRPQVRVLASMLYFAFVERNGKYTLFTGFVFSVLTYSLFLR